MDYALASKKTWKKIMLVHGEEKAANALMEKLKDQQGMPEIVYPEKYEVIEL